MLLTQLFQLRTIEQNELAIIAESNNKAILVFTVVTIIFLPLSFFTVGLLFRLNPSWSLISCGCVAHYEKMSSSEPIL